MSQNGSVATNVLWGILLGAAVVAAWLFYPDIWRAFEPSASRISGKITPDKEEMISKRLPVSQGKDGPAVSRDSGKKAEDRDCLLYTSPSPRD